MATSSEHRPDDVMGISGNALKSQSRFFENMIGRSLSRSRSRFIRRFCRACFRSSWEMWDQQKSYLTGPKNFPNGKYGR